MCATDSLKGQFRYFDQGAGVYKMGGKKDWKGMKKGGKLHIFSPIGKKYCKKKTEKDSPAARTTSL